MSPKTAHSNALGSLLTKKVAENPGTDAYADVVPRPPQMEMAVWASLNMHQLIAATEAEVGGTSADASPQVANESLANALISKRQSGSGIDMSNTKKTAPRWTHIMAGRPQ